MFDLNFLATAHKSIYVISHTVIAHPNHKVFLGPVVQRAMRALTDIKSKRTKRIIFK